MLFFAAFAVSMIAILASTRTMIFINYLPDTHPI